MPKRKRCEAHQRGDLNALLAAHRSTVLSSIAAAILVATSRASVRTMRH